MLPDRALHWRWWAIRFIAPIFVLLAAAMLIGHSRFDRASLEAFFDAQSSTFPLRRAWLFDDVLHVGGRAFVAAAMCVLLVGAAIGWRSTRWSDNAKRGAYLATSFLLTVAIAGAWKNLAHQVTPWDTLGFGGTKPWPGSVGGTSVWPELGSPGAHAASGFAWMSLYFVGASTQTRRRWLWLAPGLFIGALFAIGQHVRGAHQPSHEPLSIAIAWFVAGANAVLFRACGWLKWSEDPPAATASVVRESSTEVELR